MSPFCQTMICQGKIPYLLPSIRTETKDGREISYLLKGKRPLSEILERGVGEDVFRIARRIVYCYYDMESEYFVPGHCLCLETEEIYADKDGELYFLLDDIGHYQLYPIIRALLSDRWQEQLLIPECREEWLALIEDCEDRERLSRRLIMAQEEPVEQETEGMMKCIQGAKDELVRDDRKVFLLWAGCLLLGIILSVFS